MTKISQAMLTLIATLSMLFNSIAHVSAASHDINQSYQPNFHFRPSLTTETPDPDFDGISTTDEVNGWYNDKGGPYVTDPNNPDSDFDGVSDGEEQLFDTDPTDSKSPGIFVEYTDELRTAKYFVWQKHGSKFIANTEDTARDGVIVRRGAEFVVHGPPDATLEIKKSIGGLTTLNPVKNACGSGWRINVPSNGDVGIYTLEMDRAGWSQPVSMPLYVVFEIPDAVNSSNPRFSLSDDAIATALYNDDFNDNRDEHVVWWGAGDTNTGEATRARALAFPTDQYDSYIFEEYVIDAINGQPNQVAATTAILNKIDAVTRFNPSKYYYTMEAVMFAPKQANQCSNIANASTSFFRSAGIPARGMNVDWDGLVVGSGVFDHATQVWVSNEWKTARGYNVSSRGSQYDEDLGGEACGPNDSIQCGIVPPKTAQQWGSRYHADRWGDIIYTAPDDWLWSTTGDEDEWSGPYGRGLDYIWTKGTPNDANPSSGKFNTGSVEMWNVPYWNWPYEPVRTDAAQDPPWDGCPGYPCDESGDHGDDGDGKEFTASEVEENTADTSIKSSLLSFDAIQNSYGVDSDGNGRYDQLAVEVGIQVNQPGNYTVGASLDSPNFESDNRSGVIDSSTVVQSLDAGLQTIKFTFDGSTIAESNAPGPYLLTNVWVSNLPATGADPVIITEDVIAYEETLGDIHYQGSSSGRLSAASSQSSADFDNFGAELSILYNHNVQDTDNDGFFDRLVVETNLEIQDSGSYKVNADLVDSAGEQVGEATWSGSGPDVVLQFDTLLSDPRSYQVRNIRLYNAEGELIDIKFDGYSSAGSYLIPPLYNAAGLTALNTSADPLEVSGVTQTPGSDGKIESLTFDVTANIPVAGDYRLEGWLESNNGSPIAWETSIVSYLEEGSQNMSITFDGQSINAFQADGPYKLTALKLSWSLNNAFTTIEELDEAYETSAFAFTDFVGGPGNVLVDRMENGPGDLWDLNNSTWALTTEASVSPIHAWTDSPGDKYGNNDETWLTTRPFVVSHGAAAFVSFQGCHSIAEDDDVGQLQVSVNGSDWTTVNNYTGSSDGWAIEQFVASPPVVGADKNVTLRFLMDTDDNGREDGWYIDDVAISFDYDVDDDGIPNDVEVGGDPDNPKDTDNDGTPDYDDVDSDGDGISDQDEGTGDTDGDNVPDFQDVDSDGDGILDEDETDENGTPKDTDGDGTPDHQDDDSDNDGIPDQTEGETDSDGDGTPDYLDGDSDDDGIPDQTEGDTDSDGDGTPDYLDDDSDGDTIPDAEEGDGDADGDGVPDYLDTDADGNGINDAAEGDADADGDGIPDYKDTDDDDDGIPDATEIGDDPGNPVDSDGDGTPDYLDEDSDGDTIPDENEWSDSGNHPFCTNNGGLDTDNDTTPNCQDNDVDGDGTPNYLDTDSDGDGVDDLQEVGRDGPNNPSDADGDGIPDYYDSEDNEINEGSTQPTIYLPFVVK